MTPTSLTLTAKQHAQLHDHLFPADGCEAVALALCGHRAGKDRHRLLVRELVLIPYDACPVRLPDQVTWSTDMLPAILEKAAKRGHAVVKIHGHRSFPRFSKTDDQSDRKLFPSVHGWLDDCDPHASVIMMEDGEMFGRTVDADGRFSPLDAVNMVGDELLFWRPAKDSRTEVPAHAHRVAQTFGRGTFDRLSALRIAVVGCSGTGSVVVEQLARNCVGGLLLVDPDVVEPKNLNRILNATKADAEAARPKVQVLADAVQAMGLGTRVETLQGTLFDPAVVRAVAECDIVFGCMDSIDGRHLLNKLATFYLLPYFDLGVKLEADGKGGIDQVCGTVHYLQPGGSSLLSRRVYTLEQVQAAGLSRTDPVTYRSQLKEGYIKGVAEDRPAVIHVNAMVASLAINELLARLHPFRIDPNSEYAIHRISLSHGIYEHDEDGAPCKMLARHVGRGDVYPMLEWAELSVTAEAA